MLLTYFPLRGRTKALDLVSTCILAHASVSALQISEVTFFCHCSTQSIFIHIYIYTYLSISEGLHIDKSSYQCFHVEVGKLDS